MEVCMNEGITPTDFEKTIYQLQVLLKEAAESPPETSSQKMTEFGNLLSANRDILEGDPNFADFSAHFLQVCITYYHNDAANYLATLLLDETNCGLTQFPLLQLAAEHGNTELYGAIENKIFSDPARYAGLYNDIATGKYFSTHFNIALKNRDLRLAKHLLFNYARYCQSALPAEISAANMLFATSQDQLSDREFFDLYHYMASLGIPDVNLNVSQANFQPLVGNIIRLIATGKIFPLYSRSGDTPNGLYSRGMDLMNIGKRLSDGEFHPISSLLETKHVDEAYFDAFLLKNDNMSDIFQFVLAIVKFCSDESKPLAYRQELINLVRNKIFTGMTPLTIEMLRRYGPIDKKLAPFINKFLFEEFANAVPNMIFIEDTDTIEPPVKKMPDAKEPSEVIYNNTGYIYEIPGPQFNLNLIEGKPLSDAGTPIGYNVHLPKGEVKSVVISAYGGSQKTEKDERVYRPGAIDPSLQHLVDNGVAVITLNLPDLLELDTFQGNMTSELHDKIHRCINHAHDTIKNHPEDLDVRLASLKGKNVFLHGGSFGGRTAVRHAQLYPGTFNGYISHDGWLSPTMGAKSDLINRPLYNNHLDPMSDSEIVKIVDPILLLHNRDDNNVNIKVTLDFYKKMQRKNKSDLVRLHVTELGNPAPSVADKINKGHYIPARPEEFNLYANTLRRFIEQGPSAVTEISAWRAYQQDKLANRFYKLGGLSKRFFAEILELNESKKIRVNDNNFNRLWDEYYKPLYYALYFSDDLSSSETELNAEISRLMSMKLLTDEVIMNTLKLQENVFNQYMKEMHPELQFSEAVQHDFLKKPEVIAKYREMIFNLGKEKDRSVKGYHLSLLYKANPDLLKPLYPDFENQRLLQKTIMQEKTKVVKKFTKKRNLMTAAWQQTVKEAVKQAKDKTKPQEGKQIQKPQSSNK